MINSLHWLKFSNVFRLTRSYYSTLIIHSKTQSLIRYNNLRITDLYAKRFSTFRQIWKHSQTPYEVLGVTKYSSPKEIKQAYFMNAKKFHPDLNPNSVSAKQKFQVIAEAYELLSDLESKANYDLHGSSTQANQKQNYYYYNSSGQSADDIFKTVFADSELITQELKAYVEELQADFTYASESAIKGDWNEVLDVMNSHKGLIISIVLPAIVLTRSPSAFALGSRVIFHGFQWGITVLVLTGQMNVAVKWLWNMIRHMAIERRKRKDSKK